MTISSTPSMFPLIDEYILSGYKKAGLLPLEVDVGFDSSWAGKAAHGRVIMNRTIESLAMEGFIDHFVSFTNIILVVDQSVYTQGTDFDTDLTLINIVDTGNYIPASNASEVVNTTGETPVSPMSKHQWGMLSNKSSSGRVTRYFVDLNGPLMTIHVWPRPNETAKIRFKTHRIPGSSSTGSNNADLKRHWGTWLVNALAYELMTDAKLPLDERAMIREDRDAIMAKIKTYETSNEAPDVIFTHSSPWINF